MDEHRAERVSEAIREELSELIVYEMADPRVQRVDVTEVLLSPDLRHAHVRLHLEGDPQAQAECLEAISGARRYLRRQLAGRIRLHRLPELHFEPDRDSVFLRPRGPHEPSRRRSPRRAEYES